MSIYIKYIFSASQNRTDADPTALRLPLKLFLTESRSSLLSGHDSYLPVVLLPEGPDDTGKG